MEYVNFFFPFLDESLQAGNTKENQKSKMLWLANLHSTLHHLEFDFIRTAILECPPETSSKIEN